MFSFSKATNNHSQWQQWLFGGVSGCTSLWGCYLCKDWNPDLWDMAEATQEAAVKCKSCKRAWKHRSPSPSSPRQEAWVEQDRSIPHPLLMRSLVLKWHIILPRPSSTMNSLRVFWFKPWTRWGLVAGITTYSWFLYLALVAFPQRAFGGVLWWSRQARIWQSGLLGRGRSVYPSPQWGEVQFQGGLSGWGSAPDVQVCGDLLPNQREGHRSMVLPSSSSVVGSLQSGGFHSGSWTLLYCSPGQHT